MYPADLQAEFAARGPWVTRYVIHGESYGGEFDAMGDPRIEQFWKAFPTARTILELGSLEGGHTFALAAQPWVERVVGVEGRPANVAKAQWMQTLLGTRKVRFVAANLESARLRRFGRFDAVFCCGLLYHLPRPWELIEQVCRVSSALFLSTHYAPAQQADTVRHGVRGIVYQEFGAADPLSGLSPDSFWPTLGGLMDMLHYFGFAETRIVDHNGENPYGPTVSVAASRR